MPDRATVGTSAPQTHTEDETGATGVGDSPRLNARQLVMLTPRLLLRLGIVGALLLFVVLFSLTSSDFLSPGNIAIILVGVPFTGIVAVGETLLITAGEFDLSVGSVAGLSAFTAAWVMSRSGVPTLAGLLAGVGVGALAGFINAALVLRLRVPSFITTLAMLYIAAGLTTLISHGESIFPLPASVSRFGADSPLGLSWPFFVFIGVASAGVALTRRTVFGRSLFAIGGNPEVATIAGLHTRRLKTVVFVMVGVLAATAGMLQMSVAGSGDPTIGNGWELTVIAAVVIGGTNLFGGYGTVAGTVVGILLLQVVANGLVGIGLALYWQTFAVGAIMITAVGFNLLRQRTLAAPAARSTRYRWPSSSRRAD